MKILFVSFLCLGCVPCSQVTVQPSTPEMYGRWLAGSAFSLHTTVTEEMKARATKKNLETPAEVFGAIRRATIHRVKQWAAQELEVLDEATRARFKEEEYPYFRFLPPYVTALREGLVTWSSPCFRGASARTRTNKATGIVTTTINMVAHDHTHPRKLQCEDFYLFGSVSAFSLHEFTEDAPSHTLIWNTTTMSASEKWDIQHNGIRVFRFHDNRLKSLSDLLQTANLFVSEATKGVPDEVARVNLDFLAKYPRFNMTKRQTTEITINASQVHSGDFFGILRLDGLDPMLAWAMGSTTGHTASALWMDGQLFVVESTAKDSYWPVNGIQKTGFKQWLALAKEAGYQVVHSPLSAASRARFNTTAATAMFQEMEGVDYGYYNMLWGWVDTLADNYPCVAPDYKTCLQWEHIPVLLGNAGKLTGLAEMLIAPAFAQRLDLSLSTPLADSLKIAVERNIDPRSLPKMVEQDKWLYNTTRNGTPVMARSMVCCVFVCNVWKAGGLFDGKDVNCAEQTNWDDSSLALFEADYSSRPQVCRKADPDNPVCQLEGKYTLTLRDYNTRAPYSHMGEHCPSEAPFYKQPKGC